MKHEWSGVPGEIFVVTRTERVLVFVGWLEGETSILRKSEGVIEMEGRVEG